LASVEDVSAILALLGVTGEKRDRIRTLARHAREPNWLASSNWDLPFALTTRLNLESTATGITTWWLLIVPGLLQTPDYIRSIMDNSRYRSSRPTNGCRSGWTGSGSSPARIRSGSPPCASCPPESVSTRA
jgi:hypothetical protein